MPSGGGNIISWIPLNSLVTCQSSRCHPAILSWANTNMATDLILGTVTYSSANPIHCMCYSVFIATYRCHWSKPWEFQIRTLGSFLLRFMSAHGHDIVPLSTLLLLTEEWESVHGNTNSTYKRFNFGDISKFHLSLPWSRYYPFKNLPMSVTGSLKIISVTLGRG